MPESALAHKIVLVTGSGRGIGRELALHFARRGADVVVNFFRNRAPAEETARLIRELGREAVAVRANVGDLEQLERLFVRTEETFGGLDYYIHNAASGFNRMALAQRPKGWDWTMNINARSLLFGAQKAAGLMKSRGGGAIVAISSLGSSRVLPDYAVVGASKAAIESLVRYLGVELAPQRIRVNAVSPGIVDTDALTHFPVFQENEGQLISEVRKHTPAGRLCSPADVAHLVEFLCSDEAQMICGQTIVVDGGFSLLVR